MIDRKQKIIFIHVPKTGGTSVQNAIFNIKAGKKYNTEHLSIAQYQKRNPKLDLSKFFKFCVIRNPWSRMLSDYFWYSTQKVGRWKQDAYIKKKMPDTFDKFVKQGFYPLSAYKPKRLRQQLEFIEINGDIAVDYICKFENITEDFNEAVREINRRRSPDLGICLPRKFQHLRPTQHEDYTSYYNDDTIDIVANKFARDIKEFKYEFSG